MEVLIAMGTLAVGMLFIASVFPAGIHWTTVSSERTIAAVVADEAFAKIKLYGIPVVLSDTNQVSLSEAGIYPEAEYAYPSTPVIDPNSKRYWWSAICRREPNSLNDVQVTVFVCRKVGTGTQYYRRVPVSLLFIADQYRPTPVFVSVYQLPGDRADELRINAPMTNLINDGYTIVDDATGQIYRVLERYSATPSVIRLDKNWTGSGSQWVWTMPASTPDSTTPFLPTVVRPPILTGRYPCIAVYQKVMRF